MPQTRLRTPILLAALALVAAGGVSAQVRPPQLKIESHTLENGLRVVLAPDTSRPVANVQVWYHVGSKDERKGRTGFAHLFEHMMFRGSENVGPEEHMRLVREPGAPSTPIRTSTARCTGRRSPPIISSACSGSKPTGWPRLS